MKVLYFTSVIFILLAISSCNPNQESAKRETSVTENVTNYTIKGYVSGKENSVVFLTDSLGNILQQTKVIDNYFELSGEPQKEIAFLYLDSQEKTVVFLDTLMYEARIWDNNANHFLVTSSHPKQIAYNTYQKELANIDRKLLLLCPSLHDADEFEKRKVLDNFMELKEKRNKLATEFIEKHKQSLIGLLELKYSLPFIGKQSAYSLLNSLDTLLQTHPIGVELAQILAPKDSDNSTKKTTVKKEQPTPPKPKKPERFPAPSFNGLSPEGYLVDLLNIVGQNKVTMLDFWGTWCQPCRMQNPFWIRLYKKYHNKGFEIISIAEETEESRPFLETAIAEDAMTWKHIVDQNYEIAELYGAYSLPHAVLIDQEGKIIYHKATARDVQEYLQDFFAE